MVHRRFISALLLVLSASVAFAGTPVYGPTRFVLATGAPQNFDVEVPVDTSDDCDGKANYVLSFANGDGAMSAQVTSGVLVFNGVTLLREDDFKGTFLQWEFGITSNASNRIHLELKGGKPGAAVTIAIRKEIEETLISRSYAGSVTGSEYSDAFAAADLASKYVLIARNGGASAQSSKRISVRINGVEIFSEKNLPPGVDVRAPITVQTANQLSASVAGTEDGTLSVSVHRQTDESACGLAIAFVSPLDGAIVSSRPLLVRGTAVGRHDAGVAVNGWPARVDTTHAGTRSDPMPWAAVVDLSPGPVTLQATVTAASGQERDAKVSIVYSPPRTDDVEIFVAPPSGTAPFSTIFRVVSHFSQPVAKCELDLDGDGVFETSSAAIPEAIPFSYDKPGLRIVTVRVTDVLGAVATSSTALEVESFADVDAAIQAVWKGFAAALASSDVDRALTYFAGDVERERYRTALMLIRPTLPQFAAEMATIRPISVIGDVARYLLTRPANGVVEGYPVFFARSSDGTWKLVQF